MNAQAGLGLRGTVDGNVAVLTAIETKALSTAALLLVVRKGTTLSAGCAKVYRRGDF